MKVTLVGFNGRYTHSCMALFYVRNEIVVNASDLRPEIVQFTINDPYYQLLMRLSETDADYYFFSAAIWNSDLIVKVVDDLLRVSPGCHVVVGGPQAEIVASQVNNERCSRVIGEIEGVGKEFYQDLYNKTLKSSYHCKRVGSGFSFPYIETDFSDHLENRHIYYESSRGCPFSCTYCLSSSQQGVFHKDLEKVKKELSHILGHKPKIVRFVDRTFNDNGKRALAIWQFLAEQPVETVFHFEMSPSHFSEEMFVFLQKLPPGKFQFEIGIQSTNPPTLMAIKRAIDTDTAHDIIVKLSQMNNIHLHVDLILGLPYETRMSFLKSFRDVFFMSPHYIQMGLLKILPDTPICHTAPEYEYCYSSSAPYSVFANRWMDRQNIQELYWFGECVERFLNNRYFRSLWEYLRKISEDIVSFFLQLLRECQAQDIFQKAPTQQLLCSIILKTIRSRADKEYVVELLRYDWLRCGHRFLPPELDVEEERQSRNLKKILYGYFESQQSADQKDRGMVLHLKKGFIAEFSNDFMIRQGYIGGSGRHFLCFLTEREMGLYNYSKNLYMNIPSP
jgi:radical SAM superfamily enzyme YgiQ (UPF0313 family)